MPDDAFFTFNRLSKDDEQFIRETIGQVGFTFYLTNALKRRFDKRIILVGKFGQGLFGFNAEYKKCVAKWIKLNIMHNHYALGDTYGDVSVSPNEVFLGLKEGATIFPYKDQDVQSGDSEPLTPPDSKKTPESEPSQIQTESKMLIRKEKSGIYLITQKLSKKKSRSQGGIPGSYNTPTSQPTNASPIGQNRTPPCASEVLNIIRRRDNPLDNSPTASTAAILRHQQSGLMVRNDTPSPRSTRRAGDRLDGSQLGLAGRRRKDDEHEEEEEEEDDDLVENSSDTRRLSNIRDGATENSADADSGDTDNVRGHSHNILPITGPRKTNDTINGFNIGVDSSGRGELVGGVVGSNKSTGTNSAIGRVTRVGNVNAAIDNDVGEGRNGSGSAQQPGVDQLENHASYFPTKYKKTYKKKFSVTPILKTDISPIIRTDICMDKERTIYFFKKSELYSVDLQRLQVNMLFNLKSIKSLFIKELEGKEYIIIVCKLKLYYGAIEGFALKENPLLREKPIKIPLNVNNGEVYTTSEGITERVDLEKLLLSESEDYISRSCPPKTESQPKAFRKNYFVEPISFPRGSPYIFDSANKCYIAIDKNGVIFSINSIVNE